MHRIGTEREAIVREIFRNLITAQNTRLARDTEELLSVFPEKNVAEEVLRTLIDARLLTSFEAPQADGEKSRSRVEIIHESLLSNWPRLIRWQTQDADSAQLRDQLRQAAQLWEQRNRSQDLLWTGTAFLEFQAWRQRYPGGLTASEEAFAHAMMARASKRRRQQAILLSTIIIVLLGVLIVIGSLWRGAEVARENAVIEAQRAEAGKLLALGRGELEADPSRALAFALAATELADTPDGRFFAMKALWNGPQFFVKYLPMRPLSFGDFNPDGKFFVVGGTGGVQVLSRDGSPPQVLSDVYPKIPWMTWPHFSPAGDSVIWRSQDLKVVKLWSVSQKKVIREFKMEGYTGCLVRGRKAFLVTDATGQAGKFGQLAQSIVRSWDFVADQQKVIGHWNRKGTISWDIDPNGKWLAFAKGGKEIYIRSLDPQEFSTETVFDQHTSDVTSVVFHPDGEQIASADSSGEIRIRPLERDSMKQPKVFFEKPGVGLSGLYFHRSGSLLAIKVGERTVRLRDLSAPLEAESRLVYRAGFNSVFHVEFHPTDPWLAVVARESLLFYPINHTYPAVFRGTSPAEIGSFDIGFSLDGRSVITALPSSSIQLWQVPGQAGPSQRNIGKILDSIRRTAIDPQGRYVLVANNSSPDAYLLSLQDGSEQVLPIAIRPFSDALGFSSDGKFVALAASNGPAQSLGIEIIDVETKSIRVLEKSKGIAFWSLKFSADGQIFAGDTKGNLWQWDLRKNTGTAIVKKGKGIISDIDVSTNGRFVVASFISSMDFEGSTSETILYDTKEQKPRKITSHGNRVAGVAFNSTGETLITGDLDGIVRVGPITNETPHLLYGSETAVFSVEVHPSGKWIVSAERGRPLVRLWEMPQGKPFHTLPSDEFLKRLRALTNVRVVSDKTAPTGYRIEYAPFPSWKEVPRW